MIYIYLYQCFFLLCYNFISSQNVYLNWGEVGCEELLTGDKCAIIKSSDNSETVLYNSGSNERICLGNLGIFCLFLQDRVSL